MSSALLLTANATGLAVMRSLRKAKVETVIFSRSTDICLYSNIPKKKHILGYDWKSDLLEQLKKYEKQGAVIIPTADIHLEFISENYDYLDNHFHLNVTDKITLDFFTDKSKESELIKRIGVTVPETLEDLNSGNLSRLRLPIIVKPKNHSNNVLKKKNIVLNTADELSNFQSEYQKLYPYLMAQEVIEGPEEALWIVSCSFNRGKLVNFFSFKRVAAAPALYGVTCCAVSEFNKELLTLAEQIGERLDYHGNADIEFKYDTRDGIYKYIEMNARIGMCGWFDTQCGINNVLTGYQLASHSYSGCGRNQQKDGVYLVSVYEHIYSGLKSGKSISTLIKTYIKLMSKKVVFLFFTWSDPIPSVVVTYRNFKEVLSSFLSKFKGILKRSYA